MNRIGIDLTGVNLKWLAVFLAPIIIGAITWCMAMERSVASINVSQEYTTLALKEIREDIKDIKRSSLGIAGVAGK